MSSAGREREPVDFFVLTGFLGSGKTTLLLDYLAQPEAADTAVLVNEVGQINIDGAVILANGHNLPMALLSNGCVCCSIGNDLLYTVETLLAGRRAAGQQPFRRIILECSGLSRPGPILRALSSLGPDAVRTQIVAVYDVGGNALSSGFEDASAQLAAAHAIVLSKTDQADDATRTEGRRQAGAVGPFATLIDLEDRRDRAFAAFAMREGTATAEKSTGMRAEAVLDHPRINVLLATFRDPIAWDDLRDWLENLAGLCGDRLLRVKGIVTLADLGEPVLIQAVGSLFSAPQRMPPDATRQQGLVIIARDIGVDDIREERLEYPAELRAL